MCTMINSLNHSSGLSLPNKSLPPSIEQKQWILINHTAHDDPVALKALLVDQQRKINGLQAQVDTLFESLRLERCRKYGKKSEKDSGQQEPVSYTHLTLPTTPYV